MKKIIAAALIISLAAVMSACGKPEAEAPQEETRPTFPVTEPEESRILLRRFTLNDIFSNLYAGDIKFTFPILPYDFEEGGSLEKCTFSNDLIVFPDGGFLTTKGTEEKDGVSALYYIYAEAGSAPEGFSAYGMKLGMSIDTIRDDFGIPDGIEGDPEREGGSFYYAGAGSQIMELEFSRGKVRAMHFFQ